jgi:3' terminal RNA ribose 2'-O-methyltransferase Hen1
MFYPEACQERCTFALMLEIDPVALIRGTGGADTGLLDQYVNDRPYAASSFLSVAMAKSLRTALGGRSAERPQLAETAIPLEAMVAPLPARGGSTLVRQLFEPLGYDVSLEEIPLDPAVPEWGMSPHVKLDLKATCRLADLLNHLYVLIPVLDLRKHYYIDAEEIEKLLARGGEWLPTHPLRDLIARRYLRRRRALANQAVQRLAELIAAEAAEEENGAVGDEAIVVPAPADPSAAAVEPRDEDGIAVAPKEAAENRLEKPLRLHDLRLDTVAGLLKDAGARRVLDLGCGNGKLLKRLFKERQFTEIVGVDVGLRDLEIAARRLRLDTLPERQRSRIKLIQGALTYEDKRLAGYDAAALIEVIEHVDPDRLGSVERVIFERARPGLVVVTTPNREYNVKFEGLEPGTLRHADHRFEWTREEFAAWVARVGERFGYKTRIAPLGEVDGELGSPSQMAIFELGD